MALIQQRDEGALGHLFDRYSSPLKGLIMQVIHNNAEADDVLQGVFLEIWNRARNFDATKGKPLGWVVTLARRRAIDRRRAREAYGRMETRFHEHVRYSVQQSHVHVEADVVHAEMRAHLQQALATIPPAQRHVIELSYFCGMSQREIALRTGVPLGTIKTRLELAIKKIAIALKGWEDLL